jgi:prepilin-type N-terminal cleavage/methylation domain-containing protein
MVRQRRPARTLEHGLTLLEMLVTLVIVAMVATILMQALGQLTRVERLLESGQLRSASAALRAEWTRGALEALLPGAQDTEWLRGSERELQGLSSAVPMVPSAGLALLRLRLVTSDDGASTRLELLPENPAGDAAHAVVLLSWPGREGRLRYLDRQGLWSDRWPLQPGPPGPTLPSAVALETGSEGFGVLLAAPRASPVPMPTRRQMEGL